MAFERFHGEGEVHMRTPDQVYELLRELERAEEDEDLCLYTLRLHFNDRQDLSVFSQEEREEVLRLLSLLIADTRRHHRILTRMNKFLNGQQGKFF